MTLVQPSAVAAPTPPPLLRTQTGQFIGARSDFVPEQICRRLALLQDQVPPMPAQQAREVIEDELGMPLEEAFEWIDLEEPLGSASISQVGTLPACRPACCRAVEALFRR